MAVVLQSPEQLEVRRLSLTPPERDDIVVDIAFSGISTGTERLLWTGRMPQFPGMGYPLVPGYESVGTVVAAGSDAAHAVGDPVFVPGARCYGDVRGLFGGAASRVVLASDRAVALDGVSGEEGVLIALAATAYHALYRSTDASDVTLPELIVGHGVLGRLVARLVVALGGEPVVWEANELRHGGAQGYRVVLPENDLRTDYPVICDVSGAADILDTLIERLGKGGEIVLAGFYEQPLSFVFPPAFMREARIRIAAEWAPQDLAAVKALIAEGRLDLGGLITHRRPASEAEDAYATAFSDPQCLKMILDWRASS
ncbi:MAG: chlorophyll synthesis pathway protein BchC [Pseudomonadota bacterium]